MCAKSHGGHDFQKDGLKLCTGCQHFPQRAVKSPASFWQPEPPRFKGAIRNSGSKKQLEANAVHGLSKEEMKKFEYEKSRQALRC